jgi:hypothetical protein
MSVIRLKWTKKMLLAITRQDGELSHIQNGGWLSNSERLRYRVRFDTYLSDFEDTVPE